jgi:hypothetical protein
MLKRNHGNIAGIQKVGGVFIEDKSPSASSNRTREEYS